MQPFRVFTLEQANRVLGRLSQITVDAQERLERIRDHADMAAPEALEQQAREALDLWIRAVLGLGGQPKGVFTVDFRSPDPNVLWCWAPGESSIDHRHFTWESFKDRIDINAGAWPSRN